MILYMIIFRDINMNKIVQEPSKKVGGNGGNTNNSGSSPTKSSEIEDVVPTREK